MVTVCATTDSFDSAGRRQLGRVADHLAPGTAAAAAAPAAAAGQAYSSPARVGRAPAASSGTSPASRKRMMYLRGLGITGERTDNDFQIPATRVSQFDSLDRFSRL